MSTNHSTKTKSTKIQIHYRKHKYTPEKVDSALLFDIQNYIPIYSKFFDLNETNFNQIQLNQKYYIQNIIDNNAHSGDNDDNGNNDTNNRDRDPKHAPTPNYLETTIIDDDGDSKNVPIFVKYSPLIDPIRYLSGKYDGQDSRINTLPHISSNENTCDAKMLDKNNASYIDGFFSYLTSKSLHEHGIVHGLDYYGSYLCKQREFSTNIYDDIDYLLDCDFFHSKEDKLFTLDIPSDENNSDCDDNNSQTEVTTRRLMNIRKQMRPILGLKDKDNDKDNDKYREVLKDELNILDVCYDNNYSTISPLCPTEIDIDDIDKQNMNCSSLSANNLTELLDIDFPFDNIIDDKSNAETHPDRVETDAAETNIIESLNINLNIKHNKGGSKRNNIDSNRENDSSHDSYNDSDSDSESSLSHSSNTTNISNRDNDIDNDECNTSENGDTTINSKLVDTDADAHAHADDGDDDGDDDSDDDGDDNEGDNEGDNEDDSEGDDDESYNSDDEKVIAKIKDFPVQAILLEKCVSTLDNIMMNDELTSEEWVSILFQVIMTLLIYQHMFAFTHNDLHTNNVMFIETTEEYIYYLYNAQYYKVPTYGRIFKIIDFGRAIYTFRGQLMCSDSFHLKGDAATQYNFEPYFNPEKPVIMPNYSFDLCRFACALFDYFIHDIRKVEKICKDDPVVKLIVKWTMDDKGRNVLYKSSGEERYPDFKLYKMIARSVHNHIPSTQINDPLFDQYKITYKKYKKHAGLAAKFTKNGKNTHILINVNELPCYCELA